MYSQRGEDEYLKTIFGDTPGRFLDIGSFDGKTNSNVWWTLEYGWSGIMIEPAAVPFAGLLRNIAKLTPEQKARLKIINCAVGCECALVPFHHSPDQVSTMDEEHYETWKSRGQYQDCFVHTMTVEQIFLQFGGGFDLISIDAEGLSVDILLRMPWESGAIQSKAIVVEHNGKRVVELGQFMGDKGYGQGWIAGENAIYVRRM